MDWLGAIQVSLPHHFFTVAVLVCRPDESRKVIVFHEVLWALPYHRGSDIGGGGSVLNKPTTINSAMVPPSCSDISLRTSWPRSKIQSYSRPTTSDWMCAPECTISHSACISWPWASKSYASAPTCARRRKRPGQASLRPGSDHAGERGAFGGAALEHKRLIFHQIHFTAKRPNR
jgi:hypothetical protein